MTIDEMLDCEAAAAFGSLEEERRRLIGSLQKKLLHLFAALGVATLLLYVFHRAHWQFWGYLVLGSSLLLSVYFVAKTGDHFSGCFRGMVMPELVRMLGGELSYHADCYMGEDEFRSCGMFPSPSRYFGRDFVHGMAGDTYIRFSMVSAAEEYEVYDTHTDSEGNETTSTHTEYRTIFSGLLFSADCNKEFSGATYVIAGGSSLSIGIKSAFVNLENPAFNRSFTVCSTDQVEARYLLTPSLMERIIELRQRAGCGLQLSFTGGKIHVALPMSLETFSPNLWQRADTPQTVSCFYNTLKFIVGMVDDLNLNTRIWTKK